MFHKVIVLFVFLAVVASKDDSGVIPPEYQTQAFSLSESPLVHKLRTHLQSVGSINIPDFHKAFKFGIFKASLDLTKGNLPNIPRIHITDSINVNVNDNNLLLTVPVRFDNIACSYDYRVKFGITLARGGFEAKVDSMHATMQLQINLMSNEEKLLNFKITEAGTITTRFTKCILDWLLNWLSKPILPEIKGIIVDIIQEVMNNIFKVIPSN